MQSFWTPHSCLLIRNTFGQTKPAESHPLQLDNLPQQWVPLAGNQATAMTGTKDLLATTPTRHISNGGFSQDTLGYHVPNFQRDVTIGLSEVRVGDFVQMGFSQTFPVHTRYIFGLGGCAKEMAY